MNRDAHRLSECSISAESGFRVFFSTNKSVRRKHKKSNQDELIYRFVLFGGSLS
jgi:hypothetical protein